MDDILGPEGRARAGEGQRGRDADGPGAGDTSTGVLVYRVQDGPMSVPRDRQVPHDPSPLRLHIGSPIMPPIARQRACRRAWSADGAPCRHGSEHLNPLIRWAFSTHGPDRPVGRTWAWSYTYFALVPSEFTEHRRPY